MESLHWSVVRCRDAEVCVNPNHVYTLQQKANEGANFPAKIQCHVQYHPESSKPGWEAILSAALGCHLMLLWLAYRDISFQK